MFGGDSSSGGFNPLGMFSGALSGSSGLPDPLSASTPSYASGTGTKPGVKPGGFGSTLLTSGQGVDDSNTNTARKSLLGQ